MSPPFKIKENDENLIKNEFFLTKNFFTLNILRSPYSPSPQQRGETPRLNASSPTLGRLGQHY